MKQKSFTEMPGIKCPCVVQNQKKIDHIFHLKGDMTDINFWVIGEIAEVVFGQFIPLASSQTSCS